MSELNGSTPSDKAEGAEGIKSSRPNPNLDHRQDLNKSYDSCANDLLDWYIAGNYDKLLQLNPKQLYKEQVANAIKQSNPFNLPSTPEQIFKSIYSAHTRTKKIIENVYSRLDSKNPGGDL